MNDALNAPAAPAARSFDLVSWHIEDSFTRVEVQGTHSLTNQLLKVSGVTGHLTWDEAHALARAAWETGQLQDLHGVSVQPS